jgi:ribosomal protein S12 methylthiotransferase
VVERGAGLRIGDLVRCEVVGTEGADLIVSPRETVPRSALGARVEASAGASQDAG